MKGKCKRKNKCGANTSPFEVEPACCFLFLLDGNGKTLTTHILLLPFVIPNQEPSKLSKAKSPIRGSMNVWRPTATEPATRHRQIYTSEVGSACINTAKLY